MIRRDFILVKIREFAAVLAKIMGFRQAASYTVSLASVDHILMQWFGLSPQLLDDMTPVAIENYLQTNHHYAEAYDIIGTLLHERALSLAMLSEHKSARKMSELAQYLLSIADERLDTFSQDRKSRLDALHLALSDAQKN